MKNFFKDKFEYTHHCNQQLIALLLKSPNLFRDKISSLTGHTLNAHHIWNHRILTIAPSLSVWQELDIENLQKLNSENYDHSLEILQHKDFAENIKYTNSKGQTFTNTVGEILFHIINHSTYHRGQLISLLKIEGVEPLITDYIFYKR